MLPAINFRHGLHYHFKVRFHWPCLSGSLVLRSLNTARKGNIIKHVLGKVKSHAIATNEKLFYPALTHLPSREKQVSFSKHSWAARYSSDGIPESTLRNSLTFWPQIQRLVQSRWRQVKTRNQWPILSGRIKSRTPKRQIMHQGGWREKKEQWLLAPEEISISLDRQDYYTACNTQGSLTSSISVAGILKHSCGKYNFYL